MPRPITPPPLIIPNCIEVKWVWTHAAGQMSNVFHGNLTAAGPINPNLAETLFSAFKANPDISGWMTTHVVIGVQFSAVHVKDLRSGSGLTYISSGVGLAGSSAGAEAPLNSALVVTHRTDQSGKQFRGRTYLMGLPVTDMANGTHWAGTAGTAAVAMLNGVQSVMTSNSIPMVVAHKRLMQGTDHAGNNLPERPAGVVPIRGFDIANARIDTQRKRLGR